MKTKLTHQEFIDKLFNLNPFYRNGLFKVISEYKCNNCPIILKSKYGYLKSRPSDLYVGKSMLMNNSAIFKTNYFKENLRDKNKFYRKGKFILLDEYIGNKKHIRVKTKYGICKVTPLDLLRDRLPTVKSAENKFLFYENFLKDRNENFKIGRFKLIEYVGSKKTDKCIIEDEFGKYFYTTSNVIKITECFPGCAINKTSNVINRFKNKHGDKYDYSKVVVLKNETFNKKFEIVCKIHGSFHQRYFNHLIGEGCPRCGAISGAEKLKLKPTGWSHTDWIKSSRRSINFESYKCYIVKLKSNSCEEEFYKIGRTYLSLNKRFNSIKHYKVKEIIKIYEGDAEYIIKKS